MKIWDKLLRRPLAQEDAEVLEEMTSRAASLSADAAAEGATARQNLADAQRALKNLEGQRAELKEHVADCQSRLRRNDLDEKDSEHFKRLLQQAEASFDQVETDIERRTSALPGLKTTVKETGQAAQAALHAYHDKIGLTRGAIRKRQRETGLRAILAAEGQGLPFLGFRIFKWLLALTAVFVVVLVLLGFETYPERALYLPAPTPASGQSTVPPMPYSSDQLKAWQGATDAWWVSMKDGLQLLVLTPVLPLIGAVIGYIFGRERPKGDHE